MIIGIGIDITPIKRLEKMLARPCRDKFLNRVFTQTEIAYCFKSPKPFEKLAGIFSAKEAVAKALGSGFSEGVYPNRIFIERNISGAPYVRFSEKLGSLIDKLELGHVLLSISHTDEMACAFAIAQKKLG